MLLGCFLYHARAQPIPLLLGQGSPNLCSGLIHRLGASSWMLLGVRRIGAAYHAIVQQQTSGYELVNGAVRKGYGYDRRIGCVEATVPLVRLVLSCISMIALCGRGR